MVIFACTEESEEDVFEEVWGTLLKQFNTDGPYGCRTETTNEDVKDTQEIQEASFQTPKRRRKAVESAGGKGKNRKSQLLQRKTKTKPMVMTKRLFKKKLQN